MVDEKYKELLEEFFNEGSTPFVKTFVERVETNYGCRFYELDTELFMYEIYSEEYNLSTFEVLLFCLHSLYRYICEKLNVKYDPRAGFLLVNIETFIKSSHNMLNSLILEPEDILELYQNIISNENRYITVEHMLFAYLMTIGIPKESILKITGKDIDLHKKTILIEIPKYGKGDKNKIIELPITRVESDLLGYALSNSKDKWKLERKSVYKNLPFQMLYNTLQRVEYRHRYNSPPNVEKKLRVIRPDMKFLADKPLLDTKGTILGLSTITRNKIPDDVNSKFFGKNVLTKSLNKVSVLKRFLLSDKDNILIDALKKDLRITRDMASRIATKYMKNYSDIYVSKKEIKLYFFIYTIYQLNLEEKNTNK